MTRTRRLSLPELAPYLFEPPESPAPISWPALFGNDHPVEIEVGFGKGLFLLTAAQSCPQSNFFGIEIVRKYQLQTATRMAKRRLSNVRLACADARLLLRDFVADDSVQALHVYFPDPWWKRKHVKRRLFTPEFALECERILKPDGCLNLVTDVEDYFGVMGKLLADRTRLEALPPTDPKQPEHDLDYLTNFERKFRKEGRPIWRGRYQKDL